jgi:hypothetical protein
VQRIIQVLPGAPPMLNGVGDFAFAVARALRSHCQVESRFVVCNPAWSGRPQTDGFDTLAVSRRDADQLASKLEGLCDRGSAPVVLLQLSPYGFDPNGAPRWLARGLEAWKARAPDRRLVTYFHEIYATGWPWQRAFWLSPLQRHICARGQYVSACKYL